MIEVIIPTWLAILLLAIACYIIMIIIEDWLKHHKHNRMQEQSIWAKYVDRVLSDPTSDQSNDIGAKDD